MKKQAQTLAALSESLNLNVFYSIRFDKDDIRLQGYQGSNLIYDLKKIGIEFLEFQQDSGFITFKGVFQESNIFVTLT